MLEQEIASTIKFILNNTENPTPYYHKVPQDFFVPSVYFPPPEIDTGGDTLSTYKLSYIWFIKIFHKEANLAYTLGLAVISALQDVKNVVPLIDENGKLTGRGFRMKDPALKMIDDAAQLTLMWDSVRPYYRSDTEKMASYSTNLHLREAYDKAAKN